MQGVTCLHAAVEVSPEMVDLLLLHGANVYATDNEVRHAVYVFCM